MPKKRILNPNRRRAVLWASSLMLRPIKCKMYFDEPIWVYGWMHIFPAVLSWLVLRRCNKRQDNRESWPCSGRHGPAFPSWIRPAHHAPRGQRWEEGQGLLLWAALLLMSRETEGYLQRRWAKGNSKEEREAEGELSLFLSVFHAWNWWPPKGWGWEGWAQVLVASGYHSNLLWRLCIFFLQREEITHLCWKKASTHVAFSPCSSFGGRGPI